MKTLQTLSFAAVIALSLLMSTTAAFAKDIKPGRETAWTQLDPLPAPIEWIIDGVTWEQ